HLNFKKISYTAMKLFLKMLCASFILIWNLTNLPTQELMGKRWLHYSSSMCVKRFESYMVLIAQLKMF
uniref:Primase and DNA directed polymerase n=1 Tax=Macaca fascicularis TaxID=9541 RepID=A0A2K5X7M3_MACFA